MILAITGFEWLIAKLLVPAAVNMAIAYGLSYLGGLLFGQDPKEAEDEPRGQSFAWNPHTTRQEGISHPICFGTNKHFGNEVMRWTDVDPISGNEVLYKALDYGQGPVQGVSGGIVSDSNKCLDGAPSFNLLLDNYIDTWWQTAANVNDDDKTTYVGFTGTEGHGHTIKGRFNSIVTFDSAKIDRVEYRRHWEIVSDATHAGYEKTYLWYAGEYHLIATKNITTEGSDTGTVIIEDGGPWEGVTKIKIEIELSATETWFRAFRDYSTITYKLYELRAWRLEDVPVFLNGQPAHNFPEVIIRGCPGTLNQTCMKGFEKNKLQYNPATLVVYGEPVKWTSPNNFFDDIEFTLAFLHGLYYYKNGEIRTLGVSVKVEISERDAEDWTTILNTTISAKQLNALYKAYSVNTLVPDTVEHGTQYDLKFSRMTEDRSPSNHGDKLTLRSIREVIDVAFTHPGKAMLGVIAQGTERLQGDIDVTWISDDKLVETFDAAGASLGVSFSRNRAWVYLAAVTQPVISGDGDGVAFAIESYEGLNPSRVDLAFIYAWAQWCDAQVPNGVDEETEDRMPCDIICDRLTNVWSMTYEIAQIGRMKPYWHGHILTGWIDKVTTEDIDLITMDNTMARSWKSSYAGYGEMAGSAEVFFKDALQDYERKSRPVPNANAGLHTQVVRIEGVGVTGEALATRVGNHIMKRNELIKNINSVRMGREALRYRLGRVVRIQNNVPNWGQAFRVITSPTNNTCELDRVVEDVAANDLLWVKTYDTVNKEISLDSYTVQSVTGKVVTIVETWEAGCTPLKNHLAAIGIAGSIKLRRITKMRHAQENYFDIELETYDTDLFDSDAADPQITNPDYISAVTELAQPATLETVVELISRLTAPPPEMVKPQLFNCNWVGDDVDTVAWEKRNPDDPIVVEWLGKTFEITPDDTDLEYIYWDSETPTVFSATATPATALAGGMYLACVNKDGVEHPADMTQTQHGAIIQAGTITAALAQIADATIGTAKIIDLAVETLKIGNLAITTPKIASHAVTQEYGEITNPGSLEGISSSGTTICGPIEITTTGGDVKLCVTVYYGSTPGDDDFWCFFRKDDVQMEPAGFVSVTALAAWPDLMCYTREYRVTSLAADTYEFTVKAYCTNDDTVIGQRFFTVQELKK